MIGKPEIMVPYPNGSTVEYYREVGHDTRTGIYYNSADWDDLRKIAMIKAENEADITVRILPTVSVASSKEYEEIFGGLMGTAYERKCPDYAINFKRTISFVEYESYIGYYSSKKGSRMLSNGLAQAPNIIIDNREAIRRASLLRTIHATLRQKTFKRIARKIWAYNGSRIELLWEKK